MKRKEIITGLGIDYMPNGLTDKRIKEYRKLAKKYDLCGIGMRSDYPIYSGRGKVYYMSNNFVVVEQ